MTAAEAKALGLYSNSAGLDGWAGFSSSPNIFSYSTSSAPASNQYYFVGVVEHEFTEIMGRASFLDQAPNYYSLIDLYRYAAPGARQLGTGAGSYFSIDGGNTNLDNWNNFQTGNSGDLADWAPSAGYDAFDDNSYPGVINQFTTTDITLMRALGWQTIPPPVVTATNQTVAYNQSVPLTSIFSVTGTGITQYQIWFSSPEARSAGARDGDEQWDVDSARPGGDAQQPQRPDVYRLGHPRHRRDLAQGVQRQLGPDLGTGRHHRSGYCCARGHGDQPDRCLQPIHSADEHLLRQRQRDHAVPGLVQLAEGGAPALGAVTNNGTPIPLDQTVTLTSLNGLTYTGSATHGTDEIWLRAFNGNWNGGWVQANITDPGVIAPVVTANNQLRRCAYNQTVALTSIFSVTGTGITQYQIWFSWPEQGMPALGTVTNNGTPIPLDQAVTLSSLSGLMYTGSATHGTDEIWLKAFNGNWNGGWVQANITDPGVAPAMVTANNLTVAYNQSVPLTNIFSVTGGGHRAISGLVQLARTGNARTGDGDQQRHADPARSGGDGEQSQRAGVHGLGQARALTGIWLKTFNGSWTSNWVRANIVDSGSSAQAPTGTGASASADNSAMPRSSAIGAGDTLELSSAYSGAVTFLADTGALKLDNASSFTGTVAGLAGQDSIDLCDIAFAAEVTPSYSATDDNGGTLTVSDGTHTANLALLGNYMAASFVTASDGHGGTMITISSPSEQQHMAASHSN